MSTTEAVQPSPSGSPRLKAAQAPPAPVVREAVRVRPDLDPAEQAFVGAAEDADSRAAAVGGEQKVVVLVDQHAGDAG